MKLFAQLAGLVLLCWNAHAGDSAITIQCENGGGKLLKMEIDPLASNATLMYQADTASAPVRIFISPPTGINSSADVWLKSSADGIGQLTIKVDAQEFSVVRVTRFENFSATLTQDAKGIFNATALAYAKGTVEFPESITEESLVFDDMVCMKTGDVEISN